MLLVSSSKALVSSDALVTSKAPVTTSVALVTSSFLLSQRHERSESHGTTDMGFMSGTSCASCVAHALTTPRGVTQANPRGSGRMRFWSMFSGRDADTKGSK